MGAEPINPGIFKPPTEALIFLFEIRILGWLPLHSRSPTDPVSNITDSGADRPTTISTIPFDPPVPGVLIVEIGTVTVMGTLTAWVGTRDESESAWAGTAENTSANDASVPRIAGLMRMVCPPLGYSRKKCLRQPDVFAISKMNLL
jgi:hypothetical protein